MEIFEAFGLDYWGGRQKIELLDGFLVVIVENSNSYLRIVVNY